MSETSTHKDTYFYEPHETIISSMQKVNILLVDDLPEKLMAYETILEELDQNLIKVRSGEEALKMVLQQEFAVILLDVNMPGMDGFETAHLIRQRKRSSHTPIIFLTAFTDEIRMAQGYASGAVDYLPTPVVPEILKAKVKVFIELSQMRRQAALQAQEHALRQAAEESAERSEFLVKAGEVFTYAHSEQEIFHAITQLPLPFLADMSVLFLNDNEIQHGWLGWASVRGGRQIHSISDVHAMIVFPALKEIIAKVIETNQASYVRFVSAASLTPLFEDNVHSLSNELAAVDSTALIVPFTVRGHPCGVLIFARHDLEMPYNSMDLALINNFISRASAALENVTLLNQIREADNRKNEFLAILAHELRNPLAPIRNALHIIQMTPNTALRQKAQETIERQLNHMVHLVDDLMDVSRITQGKIELRKEVISLHAAIHHAVEIAQTLIQQHNHNLIVTIPPHDIWLHSDFSRISQIFANLLNNAAKYTDNGGQIEIMAELLQDQVVITIRDNGIGIPANMVAKIFDMFQQVDSTLERTQGGLGIGLTLVKNLVEMHDGTIKVHSKGLHQGSEFVVTFPLANTTDELSIVAEERVEHATSNYTLTVLVVDDNVESAKTLGWMIEDIFEHKAHLAHNGVDAIALTQSLRPDIVLLDIGLPNMNGYEVCKAMHALPETEHTVFIAQTGWGQAEHRQRSKEAGFHFHLVKPIDIHELEKLIHQVLADRFTIKG